MEKNNLFICLLTETLKCANEEKKVILNGKLSLWNLEQIQKVIIPEISELLSYANKGEIYFKYGKKKRLLESSYLITDSLKDLSRTPLGEYVLKLQNLYDDL
ncbi:MAG: hypothetical protein E7673_02555 [Ruminococcaceae bacterium]|nr:hypothetical protein [Oscillospiraceae bacterium]